MTIINKCLKFIATSIITVIKIFVTQTFWAYRFVHGDYRLKCISVVAMSHRYIVGTGQDWINYSLRIQKLLITSRVFTHGEETSHHHLLAKATFAHWLKEYFVPNIASLICRWLRSCVICLAKSVGWHLYLTAILTSISEVLSYCCPFWCKLENYIRDLVKCLNIKCTKSINNEWPYRVMKIMLFRRSWKIMKLNQRWWYYFPVNSDC